MKILSDSDYKKFQELEHRIFKLEHQTGMFADTKDPAMPIWHHQEVSIGDVVRAIVSHLGLKVRHRRRTEEVYLE